MKVFYLIDSIGIGGAEKSLLEIVSNFQNCEPVVCYLFYQDDLKPIYIQRGIKIIPMGFKRSMKDKDMIPKIIQEIEKEKPDVIHSSLYRSMMLTRKIKKSIDIPLVNSFVSDGYSKVRYRRLKLVEKLKLKFHQYIDRYSLKDVDLFISNSNAIAHSNAKALNVPSNKIKVIHRGRDFNKYSNVDNLLVRKLIEELNLENKKVILNVGRLMESKGQIDLLNAYKIVSEKYQDAVLLIAGEGAFMQVLQKHIEVLNLQGKALLLGNRKDVEVLLAASNLFVFTSYFEGLPGVILEAMIAQKIIIASDIPENKECVDNTSAVFFQVGNATELSEKIIKVFDNYDSYLPLAQKAREIASQKFDINMISSSYEIAYKQLLKAK